MSWWPVAVTSEYWLPVSSPASKVKKKQCLHSTTNAHKIITHTRQLQQYTRSTNNNYTKDDLKLATKHTRSNKTHINSGYVRIIALHCLLRDWTLPFTLQYFTHTNGYVLNYASFSNTSCVCFLLSLRSQFRRLLWIKTKARSTIKQPWRSKVRVDV